MSGVFREDYTRWVMAELMLPDIRPGTRRAPANTARAALKKNGRLIGLDNSGGVICRTPLRSPVATVQLHAVF